MARLAEVRRLDGHLQGGATGHADRLVGGVRMHHWDVAHQIPDTAEPVEVEHHPVAALVSGGTNVVDLGGDGIGARPLGTGAPGLGADTGRIPSDGRLGG
jgi:hypothetical protein